MRVHYENLRDIATFLFKLCTRWWHVVLIFGWWCVINLICPVISEGIRQSKDYEIRKFRPPLFSWPIFTGPFSTILRFERTVDDHVKNWRKDKTLPRVGIHFMTLVWNAKTFTPGIASCYHQVYITKTIILTTEVLNVVLMKLLQIILILSRNWRCYLCELLNGG